MVDLSSTIDKLEENIGTEGRSSPHGLAQLFDEHVLPVSRELVRYRVQLNKGSVVDHFFCRVTLHVVDSEASELNNYTIYSEALYVICTSVETDLVLVHDLRV